MRTYLAVLFLLFLGSQSIFASNPTLLHDFEPMADLNIVEQVFADHAEITKTSQRYFFYERFSEACKQILAGKVIDGFVVHQGDIRLGPVEAVEEIVNIDEALEVTNRVNVAGFALKLLNRSQYAWPLGIVPYTIDDSLKNCRMKILSAIKEWNEKTNVTFVHYELEKEWLTKQFGQNKKIWRIHFLLNDKDYCSSYVGLRKRNVSGKTRAQAIELSPECTRENILHEIGHALGLWHEHNRPDRDQFIKIMRSNIRFLHRDQYSVGSGTELGEYDLDSIMHYHQKAFSRDDKVSFTLVNGAVGTKGEARVGNLRHISEGDIEAVNAIYPHQVRHPTPFLVPGAGRNDTVTTLAAIGMTPHSVKAFEKEQYKELILKNLPPKHPIEVNNVVALTCTSAPSGNLDLVNCFIVLSDGHSKTLQYEASILIVGNQPQLNSIKKFL